MSSYQIIWYPEVPWMVGYHKKHGVLFLYRIDSDGLVTVVVDGNVVQTFFIELIDQSEFEALGEL